MAEPFFKSLAAPTDGPTSNKPVLSGLYLRFLEHDPHLPISETLHAAVKVIGEIRIIEIKGVSDVAQVVELPQDTETGCLVYQFIGNSIVNASGSWTLKSGQHLGFNCGTDNLICRIDQGKTWMLLIAFTEKSLRSIYSELQLFGHVPASPLSIGYRQKQLFGKLQEITNGSYTRDIKLNYYIALLVEQYHNDLQAYTKAASHTDIALYHKAAAYIQQHYGERKLTRQKIADALCVSIRTLTRAFEGKNITISRAIQLARLYKAREWLRGGDDSVEQVATALHFADISQFIRVYTALFKVSPDAERRRKG